MLNRYIITKFVNAKNLREALKLEPNIPVEAIVIDDTPEDESDVVGYSVELNED